MKAIIFATLFLVGVFAGTSSMKSVTEFIQQIKGSQFGDTLWGTIELQLQAGSPGDVITNMLDQMKKTVYNDMAQANSTHKTFQANCVKELASFKKDVRKHARTVVESTEIIEKSQRKLTWDIAEKERQTRQVSEAKEALEKLEVIRGQEANEYTKKVNEINEALLVLAQGKSLIENNLAKKDKASFVQVGSSLDDYVRKMSRVIQTPNYHGRGYVSMVAYISELIQTEKVFASGEAVQKVLTLIQGIIDELERSKNIEYKAEQERGNNYNTLKTMYEKTIESLTRSIEALGNEIINLGQIIEYNKQRIAENTEAIRVKKRQQLKMKKECKVEDNQFKKEIVKRQKDYSLVEEGIELISQNIDQFRTMVMQNTDNAIKKKYGSTASEEGKKGASK